MPAEHMSAHREPCLALQDLTDSCCYQQIEFPCLLVMLLECECLWEYVCVSAPLWVFSCVYAWSCQKSHTLSELSCYGEPLTVRVGVSVRARAANGWLQWVGGRWMGMCVGWLLVVDSSQWSLALLLPLQMTARRRRRNLMTETEERLCRWGRGRGIALEWFLLWQAHAVRKIKWPSHNNNNNNNNYNNI